MTNTDALLDQRAAECYERLLESIRTEQNPGASWFFIVREEMEKVVQLDNEMRVKQLRESATFKK